MSSIPLPTQIKIDSVGVGLSEPTNETMSLDDNQYMIVGEFKRSSGTESAYNLIVDHEGVAIRTSLLNRGQTSNEYALYVDGDVFVTGRMIASNTIFLSSNSGDGIWNPTTGEVDNIYYAGKVTLGNNFQAQGNTHTLAISRSADSAIDHAQFAIDNTQQSSLHVGILGTASTSPAVFNTSPGTGLEIHIGRDQPYFYERYGFNSNYVTSVDPNTGLPSTILQVTPGNYPSYPSEDVAPHMVFDPEGHIGIHTSVVPPLSYMVRRRNPVAPAEMQFFPMYQPAALHVQGTTYASNMIIYDYESGMPKNIDELYVRRMGVTIPANQVLPGSFGAGPYSFTSNLSVSGPILPDYEMTVYGSQKITENLTVDGMSTTAQFVAHDAILLDIASFCNDVYVNRDMIVNQSLRLRGQIFVEVLSNVETDGRSNYAWRSIQFAPTNPYTSNLNVMGQGLSTPGRFGVGIGVWDDEVNHQLTVIKKDTFGTIFNNMFELELYDKSSTKCRKGAYIGHPEPDTERVKDGSLVIATPAFDDPDFAGVYQTMQQNIYFFPGTDLTPDALPIVNNSNAPTLGAFYNKRVGILTYKPRSELDVEGSITFSSNLQYFDQETQQLSILGLWKSRTFANTLMQTGVGANYQGLIYINHDAPYVGINIEPDPRYGVTIGNGLKSTHGYYTPDDRKIANWMDGSDSNTRSNFAAPAVPDAVFTWGNVGIGVMTPSATLELKDNYQSVYGTQVKITRGDTSINPSTSLLFSGIREEWMVRANDLMRRFEIGRSSDLQDTNDRALWARYNYDRNHYQVVIGSNLRVLDPTSNNFNPEPNATLTVGGNMSVMGDVHITGEFKVNYRSVSSNNLIPNNSNVLAPDDIYIGGGHVVLMPAPTKSIFIGDPEGVSGGLNGASDKDAVLRLYRSEARILASFRNATNDALIQLTNGLGSKLRFGVLNGNAPFAFLDENDQPFLSFYKPPSANDKLVGFNTVNPTAQIHIYTEGWGSNMMRLTKRVVDDSDTSAASPQLEFEKSFAAYQPTRWTFQGPNANYQQKLSLLYSDRTTPSHEVFCFTNNGYIGIGTTQPEYALDVMTIGKRGSLRLWNTDTNAMPQILLQTGIEEFGGDSTYDYRIYTSNNSFTIDMQNIDDTIHVMHVMSNGHIGFRTDADPRHEVTIAGTLNVTQTILLNGSPLFSTEGTSLDEGISLRARNIFIRPLIEYGGGVVINRATPTGNLFHVFSGTDCNMLVLDSRFDESQLHFRIQEGNASGRYDMFRMGASNQTFSMKFFSNCGNSDQVNANSVGYSNVYVVGPTELSNEFQWNHYGRIRLNATLPSVVFDSFGQIAATSATGLSITATGNIGIGSTNPRSGFHVFRSNVATIARVEGYSNATNLMQWVYNGAERMTLVAGGNLGIGTTLPKAKVDIMGDLQITDGTLSQPSYGFRNWLGTGVYASGIGGWTVATNSVPRFTVEQNGQIRAEGVTSMTSTSTNITTTVRQQGSGDIFEVQSVDRNALFRVARDGNVGIGTETPSNVLHVEGSACFRGHLLPLSNMGYNLGSSNARWKDIYLAGNTIDLGGTLLKRDNVTGDVRIANQTDSTLLRVVVNEVQIGDTRFDGNVVYLKTSETGLVFVNSNVQTGTSNIMEPLASSGADSVVALGVSNAEARLHVQSSNTPTMILEQTGAYPIAKFIGLNSNQIYIDQNANVGIGTTRPMSSLEIQVNGSTPLFRANGTSAIVMMNSYGNLGVGTVNPMVPFYVKGAQMLDGRSTFTSNVYMAANLEVQGNAVTHGDAITDSDLRLKTDLLQIDRALERVDALTGYTFTRIADQKRSTGLVAQDVQKVLPEAVATEGEYMGLAYGNLAGLLVESIKELKGQLQRVYDRLGMEW